MLKGEAKKDYQRRYMKEYMRDYRHKRQVVKTPEMEPMQPKWVIRPEIIMQEPDMDMPSTTTSGTEYWVSVDADGNIMPEYD